MSQFERFDERAAELDAITAIETALIEGADKGLAVLGSPLDPVRLKAAISILIRADRYPEAADLIEGKPVAFEWIEGAVFVFVKIGQYERAKRLIEKAEESQESDAVARRSRLAFVEAAFEKFQKEVQANVLSRRNWDDSERETAKVCLEVLEPILASIVVRSRIENQIELHATIYAIYFFFVIDDQTNLLKSADFLFLYSPLPPLFGELCLRGIVECPKHTPNRLRLEHPSDFQPRFLACVIEKDVFDEPKLALKSLLALAEVTSSSDERKQVAVELFEASGRCDVGEINEAAKAIERLCPEETMLIGLMGVIKNIGQKELVKARKRLNKLRDVNDGVWWQANARLSELEGNEDQAQEAWEQAGQLVPHAEVLKRSTQAAFDRKKFKSAERSLQKLLEVDPNNDDARSRMVDCLFRLRDFSKAITHIEVLLAHDSENSEVKIWQAQAYGRSGNSEKAIEILRALIQDEEEPQLDVVYMQDELLRSTGRPKDALAVLNRVSSQNWGDPHFLVRLMNTAREAGDEALAHETFVRIEEMRRDGRVPNELMQLGTLEQLLEMGRGFRDARETLQKSVVGGRMTWLGAEDMLGNSPTWAWILHTQELSWVSEEPLGRAAYSIYATNSLWVEDTADGRKLNRIKQPERDHPVAVDLSAILTLFNLGILENVARFFGKLIMPSTYSERRLLDSGRFGQHQPSRENSLKEIRKFIGNRISIATNLENAKLVNEYADDQPEAYRFEDLIDPLKVANKVTKLELEEFKKVSHASKISGDDGLPSLTLGEVLVVELSTLRTLIQQPISKKVLSSFRIHILDVDVQKIHEELSAHDQARQARASHDAMWEKVAQLESKGLAEWRAIESASDDKRDGRINDYYLASFELATQENLPLLADDRVLQTLVFNHECDERLKTFGTDSVLSALIDHESMDRSLAAESFLKLIKWRYKFLFVPPTILHEFASTSIGSLPGDALIETANYIHQCMADPGLHCGFENSEPPFPMAAKLAIEWTSTLVNFLVLVWDDEAFSDKEAFLITRWLAEDMIPSVPRGLTYNTVGLNLAPLEERSILHMAMVHFTLIKKIERASLGLQTLAQAFGLSEDEFISTAVEANRVVSK